MHSQVPHKIYRPPPLGCGNGGLRWSDVRELIVNALDAVDVEARFTLPRAHHQPRRCPYGLLSHR